MPGLSNSTCLPNKFNRFTDSGSDYSSDTGQTGVPRSDDTWSSGASHQEKLSGSETTFANNSLESRPTTLCLMNIPNFLTQSSLLSLLEDLTSSMRGLFDFFFCPWDEASGRNLGHAIINFPDSTDATVFASKWSNKELCPGYKKIRVALAARQGLQCNAAYFKDVLCGPEPRFWPLVRVDGILKPLGKDSSCELMDAQHQVSAPLGHGPAANSPHQQNVYNVVPLGGVQWQVLGCMLGTSQHSNLPTPISTQHTNVEQQPQLVPCLVWLQNGQDVTFNTASRENNQQYLPDAPSYAQDEV